MEREADRSLLCKEEGGGSSSARQDERRRVCVQKGEKRRRQEANSYLKRRGEATAPRSLVDRQSET